MSDDVLSSLWNDSLMTLGASGGTGSTFHQFRGYRIQGDDPDGPSEPGIATTDYFLGLSTVGVQSGNHPTAWIDFSLPMRAVWVQLYAPTQGQSCGVRFQHRRDLGGGNSEYVTVVALKPSSTVGGMLLNLSALASHVAATPCNDSVDDYTIDRVVFDPPETGSNSYTKIVSVACQTMATAQAAALAFSRPYRLVEVGSLAPGFDPNVFGSEFGTEALRAMWPSTDYRYRMNEHQVIAGTYYREPNGSGVGGGLRPAIWYWAGNAWTRYELELAAGEAGTNIVATALSEPYIDERGDWVLMVGGERTMACTATNSDTCAKPHAAAWCVRLGAYSGAGPVTPMSVVQVPIVIDGAGTIADESVIRDFRLVEAEAPGHYFALGCGSVGMWCGFPVGDSQYRPARTHAAAFLLRTEGQANYVGQTAVIHCAEPFECQVGYGAGPPQEPLPQRWSTTCAYGWVRDTTADLLASQFTFSAIGKWEGDLKCDPLSVQAECDRFASAMQWDWDAFGWQADQEDWADFPWIRAAPRGTRRPIEEGLLGDESGGTRNLLNDPTPGVLQVFAAYDAVRAALDLGETQRTNVVSSVGWLVDACYNQTQCGCSYQAAVFEYPEQVGTGFWSYHTSTLAPWIFPEEINMGGLRALSLHDAIWAFGDNSADLLDSPTATPYSKAGAIAAPRAGLAQNLKFVLGTAFPRDNLTGELIISSQRGVIWRGGSLSVPLVPTPYLPPSEWCGRKLDLLVGSVLRHDESPTLQTWSALVSYVQTFDPSFKATILSGQDITERSQILCVSRLGPQSAYHLSIMVSPYDLTGDGLVDGADLGMLLGQWNNPNPPPMYDFTYDGVVDGADLGSLLGAWGLSYVEFGCGASGLGSTDLSIVLLVVQGFGFEDFNDLQESMLMMPPSQAGFLAEFIKIGIDQAIGEGSGT
jgi:hypothetical protein